MKKKRIFTLFSSLILIAITVCFICDVSLHNQFTWSLLVVSCLLFSWLVMAPIIKKGMKGISFSLIVLTISLFPFLNILERLLQVQKIFLVGSIISLVSLWYLWSVYFLFRVFVKRKFMVFAITLLLGIPLELFIHIILVRFSIEKNIDAWDILSISIFLLFALIFLVKDYNIQRKIKRRKELYFE